MFCASILLFFFFFFFNDTATTEIYTLSLHDALPIPRSPSTAPRQYRVSARCGARRAAISAAARSEETRLNSSHVEISYAVFCLKKKKKKKRGTDRKKKKKKKKKRKNTT